MTTSITDFLLARIAEDEEQANRSLADLKMNPNLRIPADWITGTAARVLAECEAKRRIVETAGSLLDSPYENAGERILSALASVYAEHPDCRDEWRPDARPTKRTIAPTIDPCPVCRGQVDSITSTSDANRYATVPCGHRVAVTMWPDRVELR